MLLHILALAKIGRSPEADLVDRYLKRISWPTRLTRFAERGGKMPDLPPNAVRVVLDERRQGAHIRTRACRGSWEAWRDDGKREARFLIGAADGHDDQERSEADLLLSFGLEQAASAGPGDAR